jgi:metallo-beta-lactamase family protein
MKITFYGAARTTTGSMHLVEVNGSRILLDCGLYQGRRKEAFERNRRLFFDPATIDKVILSHAHIDHSGNIPSLVRRGFEGEIVATPPTRDLCEIMLRDSAYLQKKDVKYANKKRAAQGKKLFEPLYTQEDVDETMKLFTAVPYGVEATVALLGSAVVAIDFAEAGRERRLLFTGDLGRYNMPILKDPVVVEDADVLITESTYGNRFHPPKADVQGELKNLIENICRNRSRLVIPSFSVGRTQQLVFFLNELHNDGEIPDVPVFVDSPLSSKATEIYAAHDECYDKAATSVIMDGDKPFQFGGLRYVGGTEESKALNELPGPMIIISSSGMCEGGRIVHHLRNTIEDSRNIILFIGYQAEHTLGRRIVERQSPVRIFGEEHDVKARVESINALSAHADRKGLLDYCKRAGRDATTTFVVHGEIEKCEALAEGLTEQGAKGVTIPEPGQSFEV